MPDGNPRYQKVPRPESIEKLLGYLKGNKRVKRVSGLDAQNYEIIRDSGVSLIVHLTNTYIVGEADVYEILSGNGDIKCIVTMSAWNSYTASAKEMCRERGVGLFTFTEFLGAVYYDGRKFVDYTPPKTRR